MPEQIASPPALPDGWEAMLDNIAARLQEALAAVDARAALLPSASAEPAASARRGDLARLAAGAAALAQRAAQSGEADAALAASEAVLRGRLAEAESLGRRVAVWRQSIG